MDYPPDMHLSKHLLVREVFGSNEVTQLGMFLAVMLATRVFEPIRVLINSPLRVTDGFRTTARHNDLLLRDYHPSKTTDHSFGGELNPFGVGAIDLLPIVGTGPGGHVRKFEEDEYKELVDHFSKSEYSSHIGQLIWYPKRGHVHVSNPRELLFAAVAIEKIPLRKKRRFFIYPE
jgi:hypothetical protein